MSNDLCEQHIIYIGNPNITLLKELEKKFILHRITPRKHNLLKNIFETKKLIKTYHFDVVHCHLTETSFIPLYFSKKYKVKIRIAHSHNCVINKKPFIKRILLSICKKLTTHYANKYVACGQDAGKYLFGEKEFKVMKNAIDIKKYIFNEDIRNNFRNKYNIPNNAYVVGNIGRFTYQKNQEFLLKLSDKLNKNIFLFFIGEGPNLSDLKKKYKSDRIIFTGNINNVYNYYSMFDLFVLPSIWEGLPIVGIEAQVSGLPCIFSKNITSEINILDTNKYIDLNAQKWIDSINKMIVNENRKKNLDLISSIYNIDNMKQFIYDLYEIK